MERQELDVRTLWQAMRRSWKVIFACLLLGILAAVALTAVIPKRYEASSSVLLRRAGDSGNTPEGDMATEVAIAGSVPVASRVQLALGIDEPIEVFRNRYTATAETDDVLGFTATAPTPDEAVSVANTLAEEFLGYRREQDLEDVEVLRRSLAGRIVQLEEQIADYDAQIDQLDRTTPGAEDTVARLAESRQEVVEELGATRGRIASAELAATIAGEGSKIIERASPPSSPTQPNARFNLILGVLAGLAVGLGIVIVRELTSGRLRTRQDIAAAAGAPVVRSMRLPTRRALPAHGPRFTRAWKRPGASFERGTTGVVEDLGLGRTTDAVVVASVDCDGEAALMTLCVARELVVNGRRPLLVDAGTGRPVLQEVLASAGVLQGGADEGQERCRWFAPSEQPNGKLVWTAVPDGSFKLLGWRARRPLVTSKSSGSEADFLIVFSSEWAGSDEPPRLDVPRDAPIPGLLTVLAGRSTGETIRRHAESLEGLSSTPVGVVVLQPDRFDETTGQVETSAVAGATPLRSRAVES